MRCSFRPSLVGFVLLLAGSGAMPSGALPVYGQELPVRNGGLRLPTEPREVFSASEDPFLPMGHSRLDPDQVEENETTKTSHDQVESCGPSSLQPSVPPSASDCCAPLSRNLEVFVSYDSFRGISDGGWQNNGLMTGFNFGSRLGTFSDLTGIGFQSGAQVGVFDWAGTDYRLTDQGEVTTQGFITNGLFRHATAESRWSGAIVRDWMLSNNYGVFAQNPTLTQWRAQVSYVLSPSNEVGLWGTWRGAWKGASDSRDVQFFGETTWRPLGQLNAFHRHKWGDGGPETMMWAGIPEQSRLAAEGGTLGDYLAGGSLVAPLSDRMSAYALVTYMHQSASIGPAGATGEAWNFTVGFSYFPGRNARSSTVAGQQWAPMLPVANNGYFLVDTDKSF
ncbi:MAG: hypothetical protein U0903_20235 [Planctomycetales bacterium]